MIFGYRTQTFPADK